MSLKAQIQQERVPKHVAVIMDGNGRWAKKQGKMRMLGHNEGVESVRDILEAAGEIGVENLTLYAFSIENWNRPKFEVDSLMSLLIRTLKKEIERLMKKNVQFLAIGDHNLLPKNARKNLEECIEMTSGNTGIRLVVALSYGSRNEITNAAKCIAEDVAQGKLKPEQVNEQLISNYLYTASIPDPELLIRTSGEYRISNYLLWQIAYTELYFTDTLWPDFRREDFFKAILDYQSRERRFGKTSEQINDNK